MNMKNITKSIAAGLIGITLIAGGTAATYATWQDSDSAPIGTIKTGSMSVSILDEKIAWSEVSSKPARPFGVGELEDINKLEDFLIVPGNKLEGKFPVEWQLKGHDLEATLTFRSLVGGGNEMPNGDKVTIQGNQIMVNGKGTDIWVYVKGTDTSTVSANGDRTVTVEINYKNRQAPSYVKHDGMNVDAYLGDLEVVLTQKTS